MEQMQQLEASFKAEITKLTNQLTQVRTDLAQNVSAHAVGVPITLYDELTQLRTDLAQSATVIVACERRME